MNKQEIERRFVYHPPNEDTRALHDKARELTLEHVKEMDALVSGDESREMSLFYTAMEEASFWLHAHIARNR